MDLAWTNSFDQLWRSPTFPMWLTLAAAAFFAIVFLVIVLRADRSVANGALTVMTLLAVAVAAAATVRGLGEGAGAASKRASFGAAASLPALSCIDDLAGDSVEMACEKILFGSPDHVAAAVSYAATRLDRLTALGDASAASGAMTPELQALRRSVERDRYGLTAHVLVARDGCTAAICPAYRSLTDHRRIAANIEGRVYDDLVTRYAAVWGGAPAAAMESGSISPTSAAAALTGEPSSIPTGKPTNAEFPSSASIPPVSIMTPEPSAASSASSAPSAAATPSPVPRPAAANAKAAPKAAPKASSHSSTQARRPAAPAPPVQLAPSNGDR